MLRKITTGLRIALLGVVGLSVASGLSGCLAETHAFAKQSGFGFSVLYCDSAPVTELRVSTGDELDESILMWTAVGPAVSGAVEFSREDLPPDWTATVQNDIAPQRWILIDFTKGGQVSGGFERIRASDVSERWVGGSGDTPGADCA